jgi:hypothetical protein
MGLRDKVRTLERMAEGQVESFELLDGSHYYCNHQEAFSYTALTVSGRATPQLGRSRPRSTSRCARQKTRPPYWRGSCHRIKRRGL